MRTRKLLMIEQDTLVFVCDQCEKEEVSILIPNNWFLIRKVRHNNDSQDYEDDKDFCTKECLIEYARTNGPSH